VQRLDVRGQGGQRLGRLQPGRGRAPLVEPVARGAGLVELGAALTCLAGLLRRSGRAAEAREVAREAREAFAACPDPGVATAELERVDRRGAARPVPPDAGDELSERERAVLRLLQSRLSLREIGAELYVSLNTVKTHSRAIYRKLDATSREEAVERARELGLL
jgi:LuxR family maltose regulon positive regulatory protein